MPTPKQLTQMAYDMGVAGVDLNALTFAIVDAMESSGEYYGPYNPQKRGFVQQYLIEEITPDRIEFCRDWLRDYQAPQLLPLSISNSFFYLYDGFGTPIGNLIGLTAGSFVNIVSGSQVGVNGRGEVVVNSPQASEASFDVTFRETLFGTITRDTTITFYAILPEYLQTGKYIVTFYDVDSVEYIATFNSGLEYIAVGDY